MTRRAQRRKDRAAVTRRTTFVALVVGASGCGSGTVEETSGADAGPSMAAATRMDAPVGGVDAATPGRGRSVAGCNLFPADNAWNANVSALPLHPNAAQILAAMNPTRSLHPDWGNWSVDHYGIPWSAG